MAVTRHHTHMLRAELGLLRFSQWRTVMLSAQQMPCLSCMLREALATVCFSNLAFLKPLDATVDSGTGQQTS